MDEHRGFYNFNTPPEAEKSEVCVDGDKYGGIVVVVSHKFIKVRMICHREEIDVFREEHHRKE